jgi:hypothetical protein
MSIFLYPHEEEQTTKINIDDLYEKKHRHDLKQISIFNRILGRIHKRIKHTSAKKRHTENFIWFLVPEYIVGEPIYDKGDCIGYLVTQLEKNGFHIKYMHPNTLFISWHTWVPSYVRTEIKKKLGVVLDEKGNVIQRKSDGEDGDGNTMNNFENPLDNILFNQQSLQNGGDNKDNSGGSSTKETKQFVSIKNYKPTGNLVYTADMFDKLEKKVGFGSDRA